MDKPEEMASRTTGRLRSKRTINYRDASDVRLSRAERIQAGMDKLYPVEVVKKENRLVKVHYVGYSTKYDEWREESDLEPVDTSETSHRAASSEDMTCEECSFERF